MLCSVLGICNKRQDVITIFVPGIDVHQKHVGQSSVSALDETICLWVIRGRVAKLASTETQQLFDYVGHELATAIAHNNTRGSMTQYNGGQEEARNIKSRGRWHRCGFSITRKMVDADYNPTVCSAREWAEKIHSNHFERR